MNNEEKIKPRNKKVLPSTDLGILFEEHYSGDAASERFNLETLSLKIKEPLQLAFI